MFWHVWFKLLCLSHFFPPPPPHQTIKQTRHLRRVTVGQGPGEKVKDKSNPDGPRLQHDRQTGFDITVASEIMAVLALARVSSNFFFIKV